MLLIDHRDLPNTSLSSKSSHYGSDSDISILNFHRLLDTLHGAVIPIIFCEIPFDFALSLLAND